MYKNNKILNFFLLAAPPLPGFRPDSSGYPKQQGYPNQGQGFPPPPYSGFVPPIPPNFGHFPPGPDPSMHSSYQEDPLGGVSNFQFSEKSIRMAFIRLVNCYYFILFYYMLLSILYKKINFISSMRIN